MNNISALKMYYVYLITAAMVICMFTTFAWAGNDLHDRYKAYQANVNSGKAA